VGARAFLTHLTLFFESLLKKSSKFVFTHSCLASPRSAFWRVPSRSFFIFFITAMRLSTGVQTSSTCSPLTAYLDAFFLTLCFWSSSTFSPPTVCTTPRFCLLCLARDRDVSAPLLDFALFIFYPISCALFGPRPLEINPPLLGFSGSPDLRPRFPSSPPPVPLN